MSYLLPQAPKYHHRKINLYYLIEDMKSPWTLFVTSASLLLSLSLLPSCSISVGQRTTIEQAHQGQYMSPTLGGKLFTSAWMQRSAEYKALCQQAYNIATERLLAATSDPRNKGKKWAIVTDIDETIVDNSANSVHQALKGKDYEQASWDHWCDLSEAVALSGAVEFFRLADSLGVSIYYISNRDEVNKPGTKRNLIALGFPQVDEEHFMFRDASRSSDKTARRSAVLRSHEILMLLGDNLGDFDHIFDVRDEAKRDESVKAFAKEFGRRFIVLPNPNYGAWEPAMNGGYPKLEEKDAKLRTLLRSHR